MLITPVIRLSLVGGRSNIHRHTHDGTVERLVLNSAQRVLIVFSGLAPEAYKLFNDKSDGMM